MAVQMAFFAWMFPDQQRRATLNAAKHLRLANQQQQTDGW